MNTADIFFFLGFIAVSFPLVYSDIRTRSVSRNASIIGMLLMMIPSVISGSAAETITVICTVAAAMLVFEVVRLVTRKKLGLADVFYSGTMAAFLGPVEWVAACLTACASAGVLVLVNYLRSRHSGDENPGSVLHKPFAFIPFLAGSSFFVHFFFILTSRLLAN